MPKLTLLEICKDILNDLDSDEVNSIDDTIEAQQVAQIVKTTYYNIIDGKEWPNLMRLFTLTSSGSGSLPTKMVMPENMVRIDWIKYNKRKLSDTKDFFQDVKFLEPLDFVNYVNARDSSDGSIDAVVDNISGTSILVLNDRAPTYWTSFDDENIYFDSYDSEVDVTLQTSKTQCYGLYHPDFTISDSFVPDLPVHAFSYLLNEAKATTFVALKQTQNGKAEQHSLSQKRRMSQEKWRHDGGIHIPNYGRHK